MSYFVSLTAIFMAVFALKYFIKSKFELLFPIVNLSIIVLLYFFGMCQILFVGGIITLFAILVLFVISICDIIKKSNKKFIKQFFTPTVIILLAFSIIQFFTLKGMKVFSHDELTHWGLVVKNMFYHKNFGGGLNATTMFKGYPVGSSLFLYFFEMFGLTFVDSHLYMAMNLLNLSLLLPIISKFKNVKQKITTALIIVSVAFLFNYKMFNSIWNDQFLAISMAFILISYFCFITDNGLPKINFISMLLSTFVLISSKSTGLILAIFAYLIIGVDILVHRRHLITKNRKSTILTSLFVLLAIVLPKISWSIYLKFIEIGGAWQTSQLTPVNILNYIFKPNSFQSEVTGNFLFALINPFNNKGNAGSLPIPVIVSVLIMSILIFAIQKKKGNKKIGITLSISILITLIAYLIGLLISYIFTFEQGEAIVLQSFVRYVNTYILGIILFLVSYYLTLVKDWQNNKHNKLFVGATLFSIIIIGIILSPVITTKANKATCQFEQFKTYISQLNTKDKVYIINHSQDVVKDYLQMRYIATPIDTSGLKIGGSPHIGDIWNKDMLTEQISSAIINSNYNYLYIHNLDNINLDTYSSMFVGEIKIKTLYLIENNDGNLTFKEVVNI